jgi:hypothetical protein
MAFDFPASPANGTIFNDPTSGAQYIFQNGVWLQQPGAPLPSFVRKQVLTASTNPITLDPRTLYYLVEVLGGGGGGGGSGPIGAVGSAGCGGGGGAGGYTSKLIIRDAGRNPRCTVGPGGGNTANGGTSSYLDDVDTLQGLGGNAGTLGNPSINAYPVNGGSGGNATGGDINIQGELGESGFEYGQGAVGQSSSPAMGANGGDGASSRFGSGGRGAKLSGATTLNSTAPGIAATGYGSGGGGGYHQTGGASSASNVGGAGSPGLVVITEFR